MNIRSKDAEPLDPELKEIKKYFLITYGGPGSGGRPNAPTNISIGLAAACSICFSRSLG